MADEHQILQTADPARRTDMMATIVITLRRSDGVTRKSYEDADYIDADSLEASRRSWVEPTVFRLGSACVGELGSARRAR
jgi:hypothetical protein